jgi:AraC-like DNA-binding protein
MEPDAIASVPALVKDLGVIVAELERLFPERRFMDLLVLPLGAEGEAAQGGGRAARLAHIRREIDRGFAEPGFALPVLAQRVGASPRHVQRLLDSEGTSFVTEVTERRLRRAMELLRSPQHRHLSVLDIAYECGFGTVTHFHRLFRSHCNATPGDWRQGGGGRDP